MNEISVIRPAGGGELARELVSRMRAGIVTFAYKKKSTSQVRIAHGTLDPSLIDYEYKGSPREPPEGQITYWDTDKGGWRSLKEENILQIQ